MSTFRNIEDLTRCLDREKKLLHELFIKRNALSFRYDYALEIADYKADRIRYLIENEVIRESGDYLEMEDIYVQFFEEVLQINEEINISSVKDYISHLKDNITYWVSSSTEKDKIKYYNEVRRALKRIALTTEKNVIDLKRIIDRTYKNEPDYKIKKKKLENLDRKRMGISSLIDNAERVIDTEETFFTVAMDNQLKSLVNDVKLQMNDSYHNLIEIERQTINYLNLIERQSLILEKARKLKYLRDQLILEDKTNITSIASSLNPVMFEPEIRTLNRRLSLEKMQDDDDLLDIILKVRKELETGTSLRNRLAEEIPDSYFADESRVSDSVNLKTIFNAFSASGHNLFKFVYDYEYHNDVADKDKVIYFCQIASLFSQSLEFTGSYETLGDIEYPIVNIK